MYVCIDRPLSQHTGGTLHLSPLNGTSISGLAQVYLSPPVCMTTHCFNEVSSLTNLLPGTFSPLHFLFKIVLPSLFPPLNLNFHIRLLSSIGKEKSIPLCAHASLFIHSPVEDICIFYFFFFGDYE